MRYLICILLVLLLLLLSCYQRKREIEIALTPVTLPDSILSIYDLDVKQDHIYLLDRDRFSLWVLSHRDGLIREINLWRGKGPGEFIMPVDLAVDGQRIFVLDDMLQRVTYMDTSGLFISSFQIGFRAFKIYARNDSVYVLGVDPETKKSVHVFNLKGQKLASFIPVFAVLPQYRTYYQGIGLSLFSPADWFVKGDTIWVANRFLYEIKAYKKDREIITIRGDDKLIHKPDISTKVGKRTYVVAMQIYCYTRIAVVDTLLYVARAK